MKKKPASSFSGLLKSNQFSTFTEKHYVKVEGPSTYFLCFALTKIYKYIIYNAHVVFAMRYLKAEHGILQSGSTYRQSNLKTNSRMTRT